MYVCHHSSPMREFAVSVGFVTVSGDTLGKMER
jgi:hypothetical protein